MEKGNLFGIIKRFIKEISFKIKLKELEVTDGPVVKFTMDNGKKG